MEQNKQEKQKESKDIHKIIYELKNWLQCTNLISCIDKKSKNIERKFLDYFEQRKPELEIIKEEIRKKYSIESNSISKLCYILLITHEKSIKIESRSDQIFS